MTSKHGNPSTTPPSAPQYMQWMAGALAMAGAPSSVQGATLVEISLTGNTLTSHSNSLVADFSGDGSPDFVIAGVGQIHNPSTPGFFSPGSTTPGFYPSYIGVYNPGFSSPGSPGSYSARLTINGIGASARNSVSTYGAPLASASNINGVPTSDGLIPITFTDSNYGGEVHGWLDVAVDGLSSTVTLQRIIWDQDNISIAPISADALAGSYDAATQVPEPSGLTLLALGAGGLITRRQRNKNA